MRIFCRSFVAALAVPFLLLATTGVYAQDPAPSTAFAIEQFELLPVPEGNLLNIATSQVIPDREYSVGIVFHYADDPMRLIAAANDSLVERVVAQRLTAEMVGGVGLFNLTDIGVALPVVLYQNGGDLTMFERPGDTVRGSAMGDLRIVPRVRLPIDRSRYHGLGAALVGPWYVPIGDSGSFNTDGDFRVEPRLVADWKHTRGYHVAANFGFQFRPERTAFNYISDDMFRWGVGAQAPIPIGWGEAIASVYGTLPTGRNRHPSNFDTLVADKRSTPVEVLLGARFPLPNEMTGTVAASAGLTRGVGAPDYRIIAAVHWSTPGAVRADTFAPTKLDQYLDRDKDGIFDNKDDCPDEPEIFNGFKDEDGCPDEKADIDVHLTTTMIVFDGKIFFFLDDTRIQDQSHRILDRIVEVMAENPQVTKVRVEGHTDNQGSESYNKDLSQRRAEAVVAYLTAHGVEPSRLEARGFGEELPIASNDSAEGRARNRRVEFVITEVDGKKVVDGLSPLESQTVESPDKKSPEDGK